MSDMFSYDHIKNVLIGRSYLWGENFQRIEQVIPYGEVKSAYPMNLSNDTEKEGRILFFSENAIYDLSFEGEEAFKVVIYKTKDIIKLVLDIQGKENVKLRTIFQDGNIELSNSDVEKDQRKFKYADAIIKIACLYSNR